MIQSLHIVKPPLTLKYSVLKINPILSKLLQRRPLPDTENHTTTITDQSEWLKEWKKSLQPGSLESISVVSTPLRLPAWAEALREYPDEEVALWKVPCPTRGGGRLYQGRS